MSTELIRANESEAETIWKMQIEAFADLYAKYRDDETNPGAEPLEKTRMRFRQPSTHYYRIVDGSVTVGAMRIVDAHDPNKPKRIAPIFILPEHRNRGYARQAIRAAEETHGSDNWRLDTILQEEGLKHLYETLGYRPTGKTEAINDRLTLVFYAK